MQISEIMHQEIVTANINDSIKRVAGLMKEEDIGAVPVMDEGRAVGIVTDRDIVVSCIAEGASIDAPISKAMSENIIFIHRDQETWEAAELMKKNQITRLVVVDENEKPVGMLSLQDVTEKSDEELTGEVLKK